MKIIITLIGLMLVLISYNTIIHKLETDNLKLEMRKLRTNNLKLEIKNLKSSILKLKNSKQYKVTYNDVKNHAIVQNHEIILLKLNQSNMEQHFGELYYKVMKKPYIKWEENKTTTEIDSIMADGTLYETTSDSLIGFCPEMEY